VHPENAQGESVRDSGPRKEVLYVYDPTYHKGPQQLWLGDSSTPVPVARLKQNLIVMSYKDRNYLLQLDTGMVQPLLPTEDETIVIQAVEAKVLFLRRTVPRDRIGYRLKRGRGDAVVANEYGRAKDYFHLFVQSMNKPIQLAEAALEKVLDVERDALWAITANRNRKLCKISTAGGIDEIMAVDDHWVVPLIRHRFSPGRKYLALTFLHDQCDFHNERGLVVVELESKRIAYVNKRISPIDPTDGGGAPSLDVGWLDETRLWYGFPDYVVVDAVGGKLLEGTEAKKLVLPKLNQPEPKRQTRGFFEQQFGLLHFVGEQEPVSSVLDHRNVQVNDLAICPKGNWAAFSSPQDHNTYIVDGRNKKKTLLPQAGATTLPGCRKWRRGQLLTKQKCQKWTQFISPNRWLGGAT
jgi:hypothetical protein